MMRVNIAGEGACDVRAVERILEIYGLEVAAKYDCRGKSKLDKRLPGFLAASNHMPWVILRDLDNDAECAPALIAVANLQLSPPARFRVVVRSIESWLFADREGLANWMGVKSSLIPKSPENILDPKQNLAQLAAKSRQRDLKSRLAARPEDGAIVGPEYGAAIFEFIDKHWNVEKAIEDALSPSLVKAANRISELRDELQQR